MKKTLAMILAVTMVFALCACGSNAPATQAPTAAPDSAPAAAPAAEEKEVTLVLGSAGFGDEHPFNVGMFYARDYLEEIGSTVTLDVQIGGVLGGEAELYEAARLGNVDIIDISDLTLASFLNRLYFASFPGVFTDYADVAEKWSPEGWVYQEYEKIVNENGLIMLGACDNGWRWITNSKREVGCVADVAGLKIRVPGIDILIDTWEEMGALCSPIAYADLPAAMEQGVVDGQELGVPTFYLTSLYEYNKYLTVSNTSYSAGIVMINPDVYNSLTEKQQAELKEAIQLGCAYSIEYADEFCSNAVAEMVSEHGCIETPMTEEFAAELYAIGEKLARSEKYTEMIGADLVEKIYG